MNYRALTGTGLKIPRLSLGTMMFGGQTGEADSLDMIHYALDQGINVIDTADVYNNGATETIVGKAIEGLRNQVILVSKYGASMGPGPNDAGLSRFHTIQACENSLRRLNTDYIDIYYMHWPDDSCPLDETLEATTQLVKSGKVRYIAVSNFASWQVCKSLWLSEKNHYIAPVCNQVVYNLLQRDIERELLPCLRDLKVGLAVFNPLAGGLLTGKHQRGTPQGINRFSIGQKSGAASLGKVYSDRYWTEANFNAIEAYTKIAEQEGITLLELSLRWIISQSQIDMILVGASKKDQLKQNIDLLDKPILSADILKACDQVYQDLVGIRFKYNR